MANTFSQIYIQIVFAVKDRKSLIEPEWEIELYKYISGIIRSKNQKTIGINGNSNHIHILFGMLPSCCLSDLVREIKKSSNAFINTKKATHFKFEWQEGFVAFSYSHSQLPRIIRYIENQKQHHSKNTFQEEYLAFLKKNAVEFKHEYLFDWIEDNL